MDRCGHVMAHIPSLVEGSLRMAIEGASVATGRPPSWLQRASDIRFVGYDHHDLDTLIRIQIPTIGEAAEELFKQRTLWEDTQLDPEETALDVLRYVVDDVTSENPESSRYDRQLLNRVARMRNVLGHEIQSIRMDDGQKSALTQTVAETAARLGDHTPPTRQVRVAGVLDMIRRSTRSFSIRIASGEEVRGVMETIEAVDALTVHFGKPVLVLGRAVYRPSGRPLRIDASLLEDGQGASPVFSKVPPPETGQPPSGARVKLAETGKKGVAAFFGRWPGEETTAEIESLVREVRGAEVPIH